jgi:ferritin-like metal-binding protein YciE
MAKSPAKSKKAASKKAAGQTKEESDSMLLELFKDEIKDIYWAEKHLTKALPKMQKAASSEELRNAFETHLEQTKVHITRLEKVFELLEEKAVAKKCDAMEGLVAEGQSIIEDTDEGTATRDVGLILAAQKVEHYEIATYGSLATLAKTLGREDIKNILGETLEEEKETDELLTEIAESNVNYEATIEVQEA